MAMGTNKSYEHFSRGDTVRIDRPTRLCSGWLSDERRYETVIEIPAGQEGVVEHMSNAGFRGLEYSIRIPEGLLHGITAAALELVDAAPISPWPHQVTYRDGEVIGR
jgi:hypothetical protein